MTRWQDQLAAQCGRSELAHLRALIGDFRMAITTETYVLPAHWASYLINGDASSFDLYDDGDAELEYVDSVLDEITGHCVDCSDEAEFMWSGWDYSFEDAAGDFLTYTFIVHE